jgi:glutamate-1-semialdehyde 2,1-aminomutase
MYHGWLDTVYWSNHPDPAAAGPADRPVPVPAGKGLLPEVGDSLLVLTWNDPEVFERLMAERGDEIAAVITEPVMLNTGCILPQPGYLELLRERTREHGALLIFDEVITGFRFARGGAQEFFGVMPDITTMAKGLGGGFPVAAIGGTRAVMEAIGDGRYSHSGTYNSNVIQMAAVSATMDLLTPQRYEEARALGTRLMDGLSELLTAKGVLAHVVGLGTVFQVWFCGEAVRNWRDASRLADEERFAKWWGEMRARGVLFHPEQFENLFVSMAHTSEDVDRTLEAAEGALDAL